MRSRRVAATAAKRTGIPIARLNSAMNRMAIETLDTIRSTVRLIAVRSMLEMLGYRFTTSRWTRVTAAGSLTCANSRYCFGAASSSGGANTTKKFGSKRVHTTFLRLVMRVGISTP